MKSKENNATIKITELTAVDFCEKSGKQKRRKRREQERKLKLKTK